MTRLRVLELPDIDRLRAADILERAADYLELYGLHQSSYYDGSEDGEWWRYGRAVCAFGALVCAEHRFRPWCAETDVLVESTFAAWALDLVVHDVTGFNDHPGRTAAEVAEVLRDAAIKVRPDAMAVGG